MASFPLKTLIFTPFHLAPNLKLFFFYYIPKILYAENLSIGLIIYVKVFL